MTRLLCVVVTAAILGFGCSGGDGGADGDGSGDPGQIDGGPTRIDADTGDVPRHSLLIRSDYYTKLVFELDAVAGREPYDSSKTDLIVGLEPLLDKPDGFEWRDDDELESMGSDHAWTFDELDALAKANFDAPLDQNAIAIHILMVDGHSAQDGDGGVILGLAWANTHLVLFKDTIEDLCAGSSLPSVLRERQCRGTELGILTHEIGHVIGLVENPLPMVEPHRDPDHGAHDVSDECIMYWTYQGEALFDRLGDQLLGGGDADIGFGDACKADLAAERDR